MYAEVFPSRLKQARKDYGLTQVEISDLLNINKSTIAKYELGQREPDIETLAKISLLFDISLDWLCGVTAKGGTNHLIKLREERNRQEMLKKIERESILAQRLEKPNEPLV